MTGLGRSAAALAASTPAAGRLFSLFIHYNLKKDKDWERRGSEIHLTPTAYERLEAEIAALLPLLEAEHGWHGFAFIFLDPGWPDLLGGQGGFGAGAALGGALERLQGRLVALVGDRPVRLVTAAYLTSLLEVLEVNAPTRRSQFGRLLLGQHGRLQYDSAKVVEAVIRIANFSRNVPLLRFDDDVLFGSHTKLADVRASILGLCNRFDQLVNHPDNHYFVFSGCYLTSQAEAAFRSPQRSTTAATRRPRAQEERESELDHALNGFATRVLQLANIPDRETIRSLPSGRATAETMRNIPVSIDMERVRLFLQDLWKVGANPFRQVISGAGLCLSDSAILDLPPFSNMRENVMWIDDHLKFALHHELRHFGLPPSAKQVGRHRSDLPPIGRLRAACFRQRRHHPIATNLADVHWHTSQYLPRLLRGTIVDRWLRNDPRLKLPARDFEPHEWAAIVRRAQAPGTFAHYFVDSLAQGRSTSRDDQMREVLWQSAIERLQEIVRLWGDEEYAGTFLHLAIHGLQPRLEVLRELGFLPELFPDGLADAVNRLPERWPPRRGRRALATAICELVEDILNYVELVRFWKTFVQSTRFQLNTRIDRHLVFWAFPAEYP